MSDEWTGIKLEAITRELNIFKDYMKNIATMYADAFALFSDELYRVWASERAVEYNRILIMLSELNVHIETTSYNVLDSASKAAKFMAEHNGASFAYDDIGGIPTSGLSFTSLEVSKNGIQGMNIPLARISLDTFEETTSKIMEMVRNTPISFSLLDPAGELYDSYSRMVNSLTGKLGNAIGFAIGQLKATFETEELQIKMGKEQAAQELAG